MNILTKTEYDQLTPMLIANGTIVDYFCVRLGAVSYYINRKFPGISSPAKYIVANPSGTYIQRWPIWNASGKWIVDKTEIILVGIMIYNDLEWGVVSDGGYVRMNRVVLM